MGCTSSSAHPAWRSFDTKYTLGEKLGEGGFGQVRSAHLRNKYKLEDEDDAGPQDRAVKILFICTKGMGRRRVGKPCAHLRNKAEREAAVWSAVSGNEHCVQLIETFTERRFCFMVMERCRCSVLHDLHQMANIGEADIARVFREMLLSIAFLHEKGFVHRDIKPANFLLGGEQGHTVKLCDFGLAVSVPPRGRLAGECGTAPYKAPEMVTGCGYLQKVDIWSLGVTAYLILFGDFPYFPRHRLQSFEDVIASGEPAPEFRRSDSHCHSPSQQAVSFVRTLLARSIDDRCTAAEALKNPFVLDQGCGSDDATKNQSSTSLKVTIGKARQRTQEFDVPVDPTVQRDIDEILEMLRGTGANSEVRSNSAARTQVRHFSDGYAGASWKLSSVGPADACRGRFSKSGTHCGQLSSTANDFWNDLDRESKSTEAGDSSEDNFGQMQELDALSSPLSAGMSWNDLPHAIRIE